MLYKNLKGPDEVCFETMKHKLRSLILSNLDSPVGTLLQDLKKKKKRKLSASAKGMEVSQTKERQVREKSQTMSLLPVVLALVLGGTFQDA